MARGRRRQPAPEFPPKGFYRARVEYLELLRENVISPTEFAVLHVLSAFDWRGKGVKVTVSELGRRVGVSRVHASNMLKRLAGLGLVTRDGEGRFHLSLEDGGISVNSNLRKMGSLPPIPPIGGGNTTQDSEDKSFPEKDHVPPRENIPPPPNLSIPTENRKPEFTQNAIYANWGLHKKGGTEVQGGRSELSPSIVAVCAHIGVETAGGVRRLAALGVGPRALLAWHQARRSRSNSDVGSMIELAGGSPEMARKRIAALHWLPWAGRDFCPRCGASWETVGLPPERCPECDLELRECWQCHELAPARGVCPYCGADVDMDTDVEETAATDTSPDTDVWEQVKRFLQEQLERRDYNMWFRDTRLVSRENGELVVGVPNEFTRKQLAERYREEVMSALRRALGEEAEITYVIHLE